MAKSLLLTVVFWGALFSAHVHLAWTLGFEDYKVCCLFCRNNQAFWVETSQPWNLTASGYFVTDWSIPAPYFIEHTAVSYPHVLDGDYILYHAGVPAKVIYTDLSNEYAVLNQQYVQIDLGISRDVTAIVTQGGYYWEDLHELLDKYESWVSKYAVSYATSTNPGSSFTWVRGEDDKIMIFEGNTAEDCDMARLSSFWQPVTTTAIRVHPLGAYKKQGVTPVTTTQVLFRVGVAICTLSTCEMPIYNCEVTEWGAWSTCECTWEGCKSSRRRQVYRYDACRGVECPHLLEVEDGCSPPEPVWLMLLKFILIGLFALLFFIVLICCLCKRHKAKKEAIIFDKQENRKFERKKKQKAGEDDESLEDEVHHEEAGAEAAEPNLDDMYVTKRDEFVAPPDLAAAAPAKRKKKKKLTSDSEFNYIDAEKDEKKLPPPGPEVSMDPLPAKPGADAKDTLNVAGLDVPLRRRSLVPLDNRSAAGELEDELAALGTHEPEKKKKKKKKKKAKEADPLDMADEFLGADGGGPPGYSDA